MDAETRAIDAAPRQSCESSRLPDAITGIASATMIYPAAVIPSGIDSRAAAETIMT